MVRGDSMRYLCVITKADIGKTQLKIQSKCSTCHHEEKRLISVRDVLGRILPQDAGKKLYLSKRDVVYVQAKREEVTT